MLAGLAGARYAVSAPGGGANVGCVTGEPLKHTRVTRALSSPRWQESRVEMPIARSDFESDTFVPRLSFKPHARVPSAEARLVETLGHADDYALFLDASVVGRKIDYPLFDELLRVPERVFLIGRVMDELLPHFAKVPEHPMLKALLARNPAFVLHKEPNPESDRFKAMLYYLNLLVRRREVLEVKFKRHEREHGAPPDARQRERITSEVQSDIGERGMLLCKKPVSPSYTDETLVYLAIEHALRSGQPTIILTADPDVEEQFLKLIELFTFHYYAMLVADEYIRDFSRFRPRPMDGTELQSLSGLFETATLLDLGGRRIQDFRPAELRFVPVSCCLLGTYVSHVVYGAETAMSDVLDVKARTGGRSTDLLGERDLHAYFMPPLPNDTVKYSALVSRDRREPIGDSGMSISKLDGLAAINTKLNMVSVVPTPQSASVLLRARNRRRGRHAA